MVSTISRPHLRNGFLAKSPAHTPQNATQPTPQLMVTYHNISDNAVGTAPTIPGQNCSAIASRTWCKPRNKALQRLCHCTLWSHSVLSLSTLNPLTTHTPGTLSAASYINLQTPRHLKMRHNISAMLHPKNADSVHWYALCPDIFVNTSEHLPCTGTSIRHPTQKMGTGATLGYQKNANSIPTIHIEPLHSSMSVWPGTHSQSTPLNNDPSMCL